MTWFLNAHNGLESGRRNGLTGVNCGIGDLASVNKLWIKNDFLDERSAMVFHAEFSSMTVFSFQRLGLLKEFQKACSILKPFIHGFSRGFGFSVCGLQRWVWRGECSNRSGLGARLRR